MTTIDTKTVELSDKLSELSWEQQMAVFCVLGDRICEGSVEQFANVISHIIIDEYTSALVEETETDFIYLAAGISLSHTKAKDELIKLNMLMSWTNNDDNN